MEKSKKIITLLLVLMGTYVIFTEYTALSNNIHKKSRVLTKIEKFIKESNPKVKNKKILASEILRVAVEYKIPVQILVGLIRQESNFDRNSISGSGAMGLTQIMPKYWGSKLQNEKIIEENADLLLITPGIESGAFVLLHYFKVQKTWHKALQAYYGWNKKLTVKYADSIFKHGMNFQLT